MLTVQDRVIMLTLVFLLIDAYQDFKYGGVPVWLVITGNIWGLVVAINRCLYNRSSLFEITLAIIPGIIMMIMSIISLQIGMADGLILIMLGMTGSLLIVNSIIVSASLLLVAFAGVMRIMGKCYIRLPFIPFIAGSYMGLLMVML